MLDEFPALGRLDFFAWLSHVMVSRQETARQLITPGEIMQLPSHEELILLSGFSPIKADKVRYYADKNFTGRVSEPPQISPDGYGGLSPNTPCVWGIETRPVDDRLYTLTSSIKLGEFVRDTATLARAHDLTRSTDIDLGM